MIAMLIKFTVDGNCRLMRHGAPLEFGQEFQGCTLRAEGSLDTFTLPRECTFKLVKLCTVSLSEPRRTYELERIA